MGAFNLALLIFFIDAAVAMQTCYYPDGSLSDSDILA